MEIILGIITILSVLVAVVFFVLNLKLKKRHEEDRLKFEALLVKLTDSVRVKADMICPVTHTHCDDETCTEGAICNVSGPNVLQSGSES